MAVEIDMRITKILRILI